MKQLRSAVCLVFAFALLASCRNGAWPGSDLRVSALPRQPLTELQLAGALGIQWWRFRVPPKGPNVLLEFTLELRESGLPPQSIPTGAIGTMGEAKEVLVVLKPLIGDIRSADKVEVVLTSAGAVVKRVIDNPFRTFDGYNALPQAELLPDGCFKLISGTWNPPGTPEALRNTKTTDLVLRVQERKFRRAASAASR